MVSSHAMGGDWCRVCERDSESWAPCGEHLTLVVVGGEERQPVSKDGSRRCCVTSELLKTHRSGVIASDVWTSGDKPTLNENSTVDSDRRDESCRDQTRFLLSLRTSKDGRDTDMLTHAPT